MGKYGDQKSATRIMPADVDTITFLEQQTRQMEELHILHILHKAENGILKLMAMEIKFGTG